MFYAVVIDGLPTVYVHEVDDRLAVAGAQVIAETTGLPLRMVFVSAHNDPFDGVSVMRMVFDNR